jgi:hypothetical protein
MTVAVLGTGLMGRSFALHLLASGQQVHVWNRRADKAKALEASGAVAFGTAAEAVAGVERIHLSLADDGAVDAVLESIAAAVPQNAPIIDHSTTGPGPTGHGLHAALRQPCSLRLTSLGCGVPVLAIPITNEQPGIAARLVACGASRVLPVQRLAVEPLRAIVKEMLQSPAYREQAQRLQAENQAAGGVAVAADLVESATGERLEPLADPTNAAPERLARETGVNGHGG